MPEPLLGFPRRRQEQKTAKSPNTANPANPANGAFGSPPPHCNGKLPLLNDHFSMNRRP
jgi:hypothetical protein